jgi:hypothetical protein
MAQDRKQGQGFANKKAEGYEPPKQATQIPSAQEALAKAEAIGQVKVVHGSADGTFDNLVGVKVSTVKASLVHAFNIPGEAQAFVNGETVNGDYVLQANDTLEFVKQAGVKGGDGFEAKVEGGFLVLRIPLENPPQLSGSGKNFTVASTHGNRQTEAEVNGKKVTVGVNAYIRNDNR